MNTTNPKAEALTTLMANIRNAVRNRQTTTIGGGNFTYVELQTAAECIQEILAAPVAQPTAIDALRAAESALALACSYRNITQSNDGDRILKALEGARSALSHTDAHPCGPDDQENDGANQAPKAAYTCITCTWSGDHPSTTHDKRVVEGDGGLETKHRFRHVCPECFNQVRSGAP